MAERSIVIPVHNRSTLTRECLAALLDQDLPDTEIVVVDDASSDDTAALLASNGDRIRVVSLTVNRGFAGACNEGVAASTGRYVVLLNNDTRPAPGWLDALSSYADAHPEAAIVGCKLLWPTGAVQHAGVVVDVNRDVRNLYAGLPGDHPAVNKPRRFQIVTAACMLIRREVLAALDGLDEAFRNGYEDVDFCLRAAERGNEIHYCPDSVVYHLESASRGYEDVGDEANRRLYLDRWATRVRHDDVLYYMEDGLLELDYVWLSVNARISPLLGSAQTSREDNAVERALAWRSRQCFAMIRENARLSMDADAPAPWGAQAADVAPR